MVSNTIYLVTGANRGIGNGLAVSLLQRPHSTVIAIVRSKKTFTGDLTSAPVGEGSNLIIEYLDISSSLSSIQASTEAFRDALINQYGITHINTIIASAGIGTSFKSLLSTPLSTISDHFNTNTLGPIALFQAFYPLLRPSESEDAKFVLVSSSLGSIGDMENAAPSLGYGVSKAGANYFVRKIHFECPKITALAVHPGWVKTENGRNFADSIGVSEPPMTLDESVKGVLKQVDGATKTNNSGTFVSYDGTPIKW